jgi:SP family general alpha glucoside:H+ symporter-like MFS transporter
VLPYFGRRPLYLVSLCLTAACLIVIGALACKTLTDGSRIAMAALMVFIQLLYSTSIGPLCESKTSAAFWPRSSDDIGYAISGELPNGRLRSQSIVLGRVVYCLCGFITGQIGPRFVNPTGWDLGAKSAFFWLGTNVVCTTWYVFW